MPVYNAPVKDTLFVLNNVLKLESYSSVPGFAEATPEMVQAILEQAASFTEEVVQPTNQIGDEHGCTRHDDGSVTTPPGFKEAYEKFCEGGWGTLAAPVEYGGQGLPYVLGIAFEEYLISANLSFAMYPGLTHGAVAAIDVVGSQEQKRKYLPNLISGKWSGTMNLTEPHCGTDLGLLRTRAEPQPDGTYKITGTKIFI